ncbi:hypothetical protein [Actinomycetospora sp. TBRC 11914]|uniref:hypothetical protein n=1 Tax=Actinomycetospora sp. TBRC 11914 TaxID=2729387 RepID=UPI00145EC223|nr:hypothetical protein [Actinomycetospora sp. TBRC 11914]NMO94053.1 hypothetical protein [Actinomycetospora sp. TBRC 11914]
MSDVDEIGPVELREAFHALSSDDRADRRPWAATPGTWWREGRLAPEVAGVVGTVLTWCTMVDDDAGVSRVDLLSSLAALAHDGRLAESDLDRLLTGVEAQWTPEPERPYTDALRAALGRAVKPQRSRKGYLWSLVDHVHALTSPDAATREAAVAPAKAELGVAEADRHALDAVIGWSTA